MKMVGAWDRMQNLKTMTVAILSPVMNLQRPSIVVFATIWETFNETWNKTTKVSICRKLDPHRLKYSEKGGSGYNPGSQVPNCP